MYVLGASFGVAMMETSHRQHVVTDFENFLQTDNDYFNMLGRWCPEKVSALVMDAMTHERVKATNLENAYKSKMQLMHELIDHCKGVRTTS
jgi:hypothetical protein